MTSPSLCQGAADLAQPCLCLKPFPSSSSELVRLLNGPKQCFDLQQGCLAQRQQFCRTLRQPICLKPLAQTNAVLMSLQLRLGGDHRAPLPGADVRQPDHRRVWLGAPSQPEGAPVRPEAVVGALRPEQQPLLLLQCYHAADGVAPAPGL